MRFVLLSILMMAVLPSLADDREYLDLAARADSAIADGNWQGASAAICQALEQFPDNPTNPLLLSNLGIVCFNQGLDSLAIVSLDRACDMAPASVTVWSNRGRILAALGDRRGAYRDFDHVMQLDSTLTEPIFYHGMIAMSEGDMEQAAIDFDRLQAMAPDSAETHIAHASFYETLGEPDEALKEYTWLVEKVPEALYYARRSQILLQLDRLNEASADIAEGLKLDPLDPDLYLYRAVLNKKRYRPDESRQDALRAVELGIPKEDVSKILGIKL